MAHLLAKDRTVNALLRLKIIGKFSDYCLTNRKKCRLCMVSKGTKPKQIKPETPETMKYINRATGEEMLLTTVTHRLGAWKWASNRLSNRIIIRGAGIKGADLRFNGVRVIAESRHFCTNYAGGRYGHNNSFFPSDLAEYAELYGFELVA